LKRRSLKKQQWDPDNRKTKDELEARWQIMDRILHGHGIKATVDREQEKECRQVATVIPGAL